MNFAGWHIDDDGWIVVFRVDEQWYWQKYANDKKTPTGMVNGPYPTDEGAYLAAIGD